MFRKSNNKTGTLIIIMIVLALTAVLLARFHYGRVNKSVDPRIENARKLYEKYNDFAELNQFDSVLWLMDTIESIYRSVEHYRESYEIAVLWNNRAAVYLSVYLQPDNEILIGDTATLLTKAEDALTKSIGINQVWLSKFENLDEHAIKKEIEVNFFKGINQLNSGEKEKYLEKRVEEILEAQVENKRRLSVCYTNLGVIKRHQNKYDSAAVYYKKAVDLWDRNLTAENNLNILLNRPLKKHNILQKLFPPEK